MNKYNTDGFTDNFSLNEDLDKVKHDFYDTNNVIQRQEELQLETERKGGKKREIESHADKIKGAVFFMKWMALH